MVTNHCHDTSNKFLRDGRKNNFREFENDNHKEFDDYLYATKEFTPYTLKIGTDSKIEPEKKNNFFVDIFLSTF